MTWKDDYTPGILPLPPVLSTEDKKIYEAILKDAAACVRLRDPIEYIWGHCFVESTWWVYRLSRHGTIAIERALRESPEYQAKRAELEKKHDESNSSSNQIGEAKSDSVELNAGAQMGPEGDVDEALMRNATEIEVNRALERSMPLQKDLSRLIDSHTKRAAHALRQLEIYKAGLGQTLKLAATKALAKQPQTTVAPSIVPSLKEKGAGLNHQFGSSIKRRGSVRLNMFIFNRLRADRESKKSL